MAPRPSLSISMPPGLDLQHLRQEGQLPRTPEQQQMEESSATQPPPPPQQMFRVKRKRNITPMPQAPLLAEPLVIPDADTVIPTIEMSEPVENASPICQPTPTSHGLLSPMPMAQRLFTPPKTPAPRVDAFAPESPAHEWDLINDSRQRPAFARSGSVCSSFSDSSVSSCGSSGFSAPNGSCTSPESVATDPFMEDEALKADKYVLSPDRSQSQEPTAKRMKKHRGVRWTAEMDAHLETTYMQYVRDPRVTPFKMLPGVAPPLGVCSRVASKARRTWSTSKASTPTPLDTIVETTASINDREGTPETIRPSAMRDIRQQPQWPRSNAATRRRLRKLVKSKPKLSAYYTRLMRMRSPSPFSSSSAAPNRSSEPPSSATTAFSSRDMKLSLITSTAPSMQPEGPLAQLSQDDTATEIARPQSQRSSRPADWFARIPRSKAHQKSLSLQSELSLQNQGLQPAPLDSPFDEGSRRTHLLHSMANTKSLGRSEFKDHSRMPSLDSPFEMPQGAPTAPRSLKRRFKSDEEKPRRPVLEDVFGPSQSEDAGIVRNRGFTVGAVRATDNLARLFEPPPPMPNSATATRNTAQQTPAVGGADEVMTEAPPFPDLGPIGSRSAPRRLAEPVPRLGSPFTEAGQPARTHNTFPRNYIATNKNPTPFQKRLRELMDEHQQEQPR